MHNNLPTKFFFINNLDENHIRKLDKKIAIIYRNYSIKLDKKLILRIKTICKKDGRKFFLSNNMRLAITLGLDGLYLPSFYKKQNINKSHFRKNFTIIGSAHSIEEVRIKEKQGVDLIFLAPLFKNSKNKRFLNPVKFNLLSLQTNNKIIALGGILPKNLNRLKIVNAYGFAGISYFKNDNKIKL